ncbi:MAG: hypothetical protein II845_10520, partial [Oscillospiraceae bacterium]|nr:hypothetical protein [Oscillospiraceae bacterium]
MAAAKKNKGQEEKITALYARLSDDDPENEKKGVSSDKESNSIQNQRMILYDYARAQFGNHVEQVTRDDERLGKGVDHDAGNVLFIIPGQIGGFQKVFLYLGE